MANKIIHSLPKIIVLMGPTASGKTKLGVRLAYHLKGEIISADSRQVYRGMDIGTGKDLPDYVYRGKNIPYHLIDVASPKSNFNVSKFKKQAQEAIDQILKKGKLPIVVGGTGLYLQALVDNYDLSDNAGSKQLRMKLEKLGADKLFKRIEKIYPEFAKRINNSDRKNARRLARYLELLESGEEGRFATKKTLYNSLLLSTDVSNEEMKEKIKARLKVRVEKEGLVEEVENLRQEGISYQRLISFGLEYKYVSLYLQEEISKDEMIEKLATAIYRFAKRQKTWFKRWEKQGRKIYKVKDYKQAKVLVDKFLE